jgi:hypothetical protein
LISRAQLISWSFELDRVARVLAIARAELMFRLLDENGWLELSRRLYGRSLKYTLGSVHNESGLFEFEQLAIERYFPAPPASILVGACGGGRELFGLVELGYRIASAYDPVAPFIEALRRDSRLLDAKDRLYVGTHQALDSMGAGSNQHLGTSRVDAVLVGWGSFTHVLRAERRVAFLRSLRSLCPRGPVLLSFFVAHGTEEGERPGRLRSRLRKLLGTDDSMFEAGDGVHGGTGGIHYFTETSFVAEAERAGYTVRHYQEHEVSAAHAVLIPESTEVDG